MSRRAVGFIFARGGSKGVLRKNLRLLQGKPLVAHAVEAALASRAIERVIVSTDDEEIARVAEDFGAEVPFLRPAELASDTSAEILSWKHAIEHTRGRGIDFEAFVSVPPTAPLRTPEDIDACIDLFFGSESDLVLSVTETNRNPYFNMVTLDVERRARICMTPDENVVRRQDAPPIFEITTVAYVADPDYVLATEKLLDGVVRAVEVDREHAVDIDTELDLAVAEVLLERRRRDNG